jgi:hypothetical protein
MPDSLEGLSAGAQIQLQNADPELFQLLGNTAPAELELAAMNHQLGDAAPTPQQLQDAATAARVEELLAAGNPFGTQGHYEGEQYVPGTPANVTAAFELESLNPELAARLKAEATPAPAPTPEQQRDAALFSAYAYS